MASILSQQRRKDEEDIIDMRSIEQSYGSDFPHKVTPHSLEINTYVDSTIASKSMVPSVDLEDGLHIYMSDHLSD